MIGVQRIFDLVAHRILLGESTAGMEEIVPLGRMNKLVQLRNRLLAEVFVLVLRFRSFETEIDGLRIRSKEFRGKRNS